MESCRVTAAAEAERPLLFLPHEAMRRSLSASAVLLTALGALALGVVACGSAEDPDLTFGKRKGASDVEGTDGEGTFGGGPGSTTVSPQDACATSSASAEAPPVQFVFMVDKSGSMQDDGKWLAAVSALKSVFGGSAVSKNLSASLQFFPMDSDALECSVPAYQAPAVAMTKLPATSFATRLDATIPDGSTPTLPALQGALAYAQQAKAQAGGAKVVVVLVTDGDPVGCNSDVDTVSAAASAAAAQVPTYVIGVGTELTKMNQVAAAGGTKQAILISTANPTQTAADLEKAIGQVQAQAVTCDYKIPTAPNGQRIDVDKVNVRLTPGSGQAETLTYSKDCKDGKGWRYDNVASPSKIEICPTTCNAAKADAKAKMDVFFGCATQGGVVR